MPFLRRYAIIDVEIASGGIRVEIKTAAAIGMGAVGTVYAKRLYDQYGSHFFAIADHERAERLRSSGVTLDGEAFSHRFASRSRLTARWISSSSA